MDLALNGKRALVTGSTSGIGQAIALALAAEGVAVVVHGRDATRAAAVVDDIRADGGLAATATGDLTDDDAAAAVAQQATQAFGGIDILVDNMGGTAATDGWSDPDPRDWMALYDSNVLSAVRLIGALTPAMRTVGWGRVIQIGSGAHPNPLPQRAAYCAAKAALANLTVSLTKELSGTGITVNTISPGPTDTDGFQDTARAFAQHNGLGDDIAAATTALLAGPLANPSDRLVQPREIGALVALLASPLAASVNGANIRIDGGAIPTVN
ncbi:SDR family NAD(P)-dependent oxidoreductase [Nocardia sp. alder85J]|uniref:SDR family NAD(P)-dependent oxidoreductase n=1 Tax=Nocardia sp. alder85J TaxID=2862949 RepID=UPI001CD5DFC4|nr:SDR family NAD(P)-dependent oxidoreductase [Nocardia sp. alder85J]MCX4091467.1 SDR family NAD(P)-dependent oxidoreductase [Nocardia sp. alder85J]